MKDTDTDTNTDILVAIVLIVCLAALCIADLACHAYEKTHPAPPPAAVVQQAH